MSNKHYASLSFGISLVDRHGNPISFLRNDETDDEYIARIHGGLFKPTIPYEGNEVVWENYARKQRSITKTSGLNIVEHCLKGSEGDSVYILAISGVYNTADSGDNPYEDLQLEINPRWRQMFKDFYKKAGLKFKEPKWILSVSWDR